MPPSSKKAWQSLPSLFQRYHQGPERGRDLPEVTQQIRILSQGAVPSSFNRSYLPHFPTSGWGWGDPRFPEGGPSRGLGECLPAFPTRVLLWAPCPAPSSHRPPPLRCNPGHPSRDDVSRAGNWAGPRKSPSGWQIPTGLEAQVRETPSQTAQLLVPCALNLSSGGKQS